MKPCPFLVALALLFVTASCKKSTPPDAIPPRSVITFRVPDVSTDRNRRFSGETEPTTSVELGFQVSGRIEEISAETGRHYAAGEVLARLDPSLYQADLQTARAQALQTTQELRRTQELAESGNASKASFDAAIANQRAAQATLKSAQLAVEYTTLKMPYDGFVSSVPGNRNQVVSVGTPVVNIQSEVGMDFEVGIPTSLIARIKMDQDAAIVLSALPDQELAGKVTEVSRLAQADTTYPVTLRIQNSADYPDLRAGMDGEAIFEFPSEGGNGFAVPVSAVQAAPDGTNYVWLIDDSEAATRAVTRHQVAVGSLIGDGLIAVTSGLEPGQLLVAKGISHLSEGMVVTMPSQ